MEVKMHLLFFIILFQKMVTLFLFVTCTNLGKGKWKRKNIL